MRVERKIGFVLGALGCVLVWYSVGWVATFGVALFITGNNLEQEYQD